MNRYRKKPVVIEAMRFMRENLESIKEFGGENIGNYVCARHPSAKAELEILTLEDGHDKRVKHIATEGDWIIKGVKGEFYPCKPDIFAATYEKETN